VATRQPFLDKRASAPFLHIQPSPVGAWGGEAAPKIYICFVVGFGGSVAKAHDKTTLAGGARYGSAMINGIMARVDAAKGGWHPCAGGCA
jgi:hypothetical protein